MLGNKQPKGRCETHGFALLHAGKFLYDPSLHCLVLRDAADPGFPSFPVIRSSHLSIFADRLVPSGFLNQGGDPFLMELYRCIGGVQSEQNISVENHRGKCGTMYDKVKHAPQPSLQICRFHYI